MGALGLPLFVVAREITSLAKVVNLTSMCLGNTAVKTYHVNVPGDPDTKLKKKVKFISDQRVRLSCRLGPQLLILRHMSVYLLLLLGTLRKIS